MLAFGSDGDTRFLKSQKIAMNYGSINNFCGFPIAGSIDAKLCTIQDPLHLLKKMKTSLYDDVDLLQVGKFTANLTHLINVYKQFHKNEHNLILSDIDPYDSMNYACLDKIISDSVLKLLRNIKNAEGTIVFLEVMKAIKAAYVNKDTPLRQKIFQATWSLHFLRLWKSWLINNKISTKHFISTNSYECAEVNFLFLIKMVQLRKSEHIHYLNSQINEGFFRKLRSFCGVEDLVVSSSIKGVLTRIQKIQTEERISSDLMYKYSFQKLESKKNSIIECANMSIGEIAQTISEAINFANFKAISLGMDVSSVDMRKLVIEVKETRKTTQKKLTQNEEDEDNEEENYDDNSEDENVEDLLDSVNDMVNIENIDQDIEDSSFKGSEVIEVQNILFTNENSTKSTIQGIYKGNNITMSKNRLCSLLQNNKIKISSDIRRRFINKKDVNITKTAENASFWREKAIVRGDTIVIHFQNEVFMGNVLNMQYCDRKSKKSRKFGKFLINFEDNKLNGLKVLLDPLYYVSPDLEVLERKTKLYIDVKNYLCHAIYGKCSISLDEKDVLQNIINNVISKS